MNSGQFRPGDFVIVDADDVIQLMFRTPRCFDGLVIEKMTPDSQSEFYSLYWDGNLIVVPAERMRRKELFNTHTGEKNE